MEDSAQSSFVFRHRTKARHQDPREAILVSCFRVIWLLITRMIELDNRSHQRNHNQ
jgi:hypothetical protein